MGGILELRHVSKLYGNNLVVNDVTFSIKKGSVCGLLGPNGAGKTTIMKMIMNEIKCDRGSILVDGNLNIKYLQDVPEFYEFYTIREYLGFILDISHYNGDKDARVEEVFTLLGLKAYENVIIKKLSRGLRQKVGIAGVIVSEPDILVLDEPVSALDPIGRKEMFDIIKTLRGRVTIIFSSHILNDVERICDHIILINRGNIILDKEIDEASLEEDTLLVKFKTKDDLLIIKEKLNYDNCFSDRIENCLEIRGEDINKLEEDVLKLLLKNKVIVNSISIKKESLEEIFLREVRNNG